MPRLNSRPFAVEQLFGREILQLSPRMRRRCVEEGVRYWRRAGFPFPRLSLSDVRRQYHTFHRSPFTENGSVPLGSSTVGLRLVNAYHPQMWMARSHRHRGSPLFYFSDDDHLASMLERAPRFWPNRRCWSAQAVRNLSRIYYGGRIANFRPVIARALYSTYSRGNDTIVDFSSGYGGRMLAALSLGRNYIGIDPARKQVKGLLAMKRDLTSLAPGQATVIQACAEDAMVTIPTGSVDLVFSSPPFYDLEVYSDERTQSSKRYPTYGEWRKGFLETVIEQSRRILRRGGVFAIHVPSERKSPIGQDAFGFAAELFSPVERHAVEMASRPLQRAGEGRSTRTEPIGVFRKN